jgi:NAD(P)-dependent dehydrogenase (short-subunit alcohol dehydrogenase family)
MSARIAVVAGAGGGLGQATVRLLHAAGLTVVAVDRSPARLADLPADIHREVVDVTDPAAAVPLLRRVAAQVGAPQILINVIGMHALGDFRTVEAAPGAAAYGVSKAALAHLGRTLDLELRPQGTRVHVILPQLIATAANKAALPSQLLSSATTPEAVAGVIMSLVADGPAAIQDVLVPVYGN